MLNLCETYDASTIQQLYKTITDKESKELTTKNVFPVSLTQSTFDGKTGNRLDTILASNNHIYVPFNGSYGDTRLQIEPDRRRAGLILTFKDFNNKAHSQKYVGTSTDDNSWRLDSNWIDVFESFEELSFINEMKDYFTNLIENTQSPVKTIIVESLPERGESGILYLMKNDLEDANNVYTEYLWIESGNKYEIVGSIGKKEAPVVIFDIAINENSTITCTYNVSYSELLDAASNPDSTIIIQIRALDNVLSTYKGCAIFNIGETILVSTAGGAQVYKITINVTESSCTPEFVYDLPKATYDNIGGIKVNGKVKDGYPVKLSEYSGNYAYVEIPDATLESKGLMTPTDKSMLVSNVIFKVTGDSLESGIVECDKSHIDILSAVVTSKIMPRLVYKLSIYFLSIVKINGNNITFRGKYDSTKDIVITSSSNNITLTIEDSIPEIIFYGVDDITNNMTVTCNYTIDEVKSIINNSPDFKVSLRLTELPGLIIDLNVTQLDFSESILFSGIHSVYSSSSTITIGYNYTENKWELSTCGLATSSSVNNAINSSKAPVVIFDCSNFDINSETSSATCSLSNTEILKALKKSECVVLALLPDNITVKLTEIYVEGNNFIAKGFYSDIYGYTFSVRSIRNTLSASRLVVIPQANGTAEGTIRVNGNITNGGYAVKYTSEDPSAYVQIPNATTTVKGLMSAEDKAKLDNITGNGGGGNANQEILTKAEYDALTTKDENKIYFIKG